MPKSNLPAKSDAPAAPRQVFDSEAGKLVPITDEQSHRAMWLQRQIEAASLVTGVALKHMRDEKLYLALGFSCFREYADTALPFGRQQAYKYVAIGERFAPLLPTLGDESVASMRHSNDDDPRAEILASLGNAKLYELTKIEDAQFEDIIDTGRLVMPDGETSYSLEELKTMNCREVARVVKEAQMERKAWMARIEQLEAEKQLLKSEAKSDEEKILKAEEQIEQARALELLYGKHNRSFEDTQRLLNETRTHLAEVRRRVFNCGITEESPEALKTQLVEIIREAGSIFSGMRGTFNDVVWSTTDQILDEDVAGQWLQKDVVDYSQNGHEE